MGVVPDRQGSAVRRERADLNGRVAETQLVVMKLQLLDDVAADRARGMSERRHGEPRHELAFRRASTDAGALLDQDDAQAAFRQGGGAREAVDAAADHDRVVTRRHYRDTSLTMRSAAFLPGAPMMPPPGCVADPHRYNRSIGVE